MRQTYGTDLFPRVTGAAKKMSNLPKVTGLESGKAGFNFQVAQKKVQPPLVTGILHLATSKYTLVVGNLKSLSHWQSHPQHDLEDKNQSKLQLRK